MNNIDEVEKDTSYACGQLDYVLIKLPGVVETIRKAHELLASSSDFITSSCKHDVKRAADDLEFCISVIQEARDTAKHDVHERNRRELNNV